ncbi:YbaN family protein [Pseudomonas sp. Marseille-QA0892]
MKSPRSSSPATDLPATDGAHHTVRHPLVRALLISIGFLSVALGVLGIFLPLLPTTPFLLLAAGCFARSSPRFYRWLTSHPRLGPWIRDYLDGRGIPLKAKYWAVGLLWSSIGFSAWIVDVLWVRLVLLTCAVLVTLYILRQPTRPL